MDISSDISFIQSLSFKVIFTVVVATYSVYLIGLGIYRVYFDSLSHFPGPKLAAFTTWYQAYYDIYYYGPIIRINPHELHISDPNFIDILFTGSTQKRDKYKWFGRSILLPDSVGATIPHDLHRKRRAAINPFFSKGRVGHLEPTIQGIISTLLQRMSEYGANEGVMRMSLAYRATTCDVITGYSFGKSTNYLKQQDFNIAFFSAVDAMFALAWPLTYIWWLGPLLNSTPPLIMGYVNPGFKSLRGMQVEWIKQIEDIRTSPDLKSNNSTIFHGVLNSKLPPEEKSPSRLYQDAQQLVFAGQDTTAYTLSAITFELLAYPDKLVKLKAELAAAFPNPDNISAAVCENLPYLTAVIQEGIRLHPGGLVRMTRVAPHQTMIYSNKKENREWTIKPGTPVSMTAWTVQMNPDIFPAPKKFEPERWIDNPHLDKYLIAFSKGTRICVGFHLAYLELYLVLAGVFRRYDMYDGTGKQSNPTLELYDTIRERDIDPVVDHIIPYPAAGSQGLRLVIRHGSQGVEH
ncbi:cytochrome P450 [Patellaria atrata CBS 101060]|uniref:Cytochrome P450 n=1 Tax=Patellaria atrata CBS 101060 TaxID=1346257 RepID=A0A9P4VPZ0_9PEZI|nr:cytochrome P450 [Patellaria atrata CBS 101060]